MRILVSGPKNQSNPTSLLTAKQIADALCVSQTTVRHWAKSGRIDAVRLPSGAYRFSPEIINQILRSESDAESNNQSCK